MCWADIDYHCEHAGLIRVYAHGQEYGDPYCLALPFVVDEPGVIQFVGLSQRLRQCQVRAMAVSCRAQGLRAVRERKSGANPGIKMFV